MAQQPPVPRDRLGMVQLASGLNVAVGVWLLLAPFVLSYAWLTRAAWNDVFVGVVVLVLAITRLVPLWASPAFSWVNLVLGLWLVAAPFVLGYTGLARALWNDVLAGLAVAALAAWSALATPRPGGSPAR